VTVNKQNYKSLFIGGLGGSGKTVIIFGLLKILNELGYKVAYFKPIALGKMRESGFIYDPDVITMINFLDINLDVETVSPITYCLCGKYQPSYDVTDNIINHITKYYEKIATNNDIVLIEGCETPIGAGVNQYEVAKILKSKFIYIHKMDSSSDFPEYVYAHEDIGIVLNFLPSSDLYNVINFLKDNNISGIYGVIPKCKELLPKIGEVLDSINGKLIYETDYNVMNKTIDSMLIIDTSGCLCYFYSLTGGKSFTCLYNKKYLANILNNYKLDLIIGIGEKGQRFVDVINMNKDIEKRVIESRIPVVYCNLSFLVAMNEIGKIVNSISWEFLKRREKFIYELIKKHLYLNEIYHDLGLI